MSTPQSRIFICSGVKLDSRYEHSIYFESAAAQQEYFAAKTVRVLAAYSYLRKTWPLKVEASMEEAKTWSYLFFQNGSSGKFYYYFINTVEYINDNTVELGLELDVLQTYHFDYEMLPCFIERQHAHTDFPGQHTVDEGLEIGELVDNHMEDYNPGELCIMIMATINPGASTESAAVPALPYMYNGVFSGVKIWAVDGSRWQDWGEQLETLDRLGKSDAVLSMWMYPKNLVKLAGEATWDDITELVKPVEEAMMYNDPDGGENLVMQITPPKQTLCGQTVKNNKMHTYPFHFLYVTNNQGESATYHYEAFANRNNITFQMSGALSPDGGVRIVPLDYGGSGLPYNYKEGLNLSGYPTCAWNNDVYKMWLAQNQNTHSLTMATGGLKVAGGLVGAIATAFTGVGALAGIGTAISGAQEIANHLAQKADKAIEPPQAKGSFSTSVNITNNKHCFSFYERCLNREHAAIIDGYFTRYGYKVNIISTPTLDHRDAFTYTKTIGCLIDGDLCNEDKLKIESIFDRGVTYWMDGDTIGDYTQDNACNYKYIEG